MWIPACTVEFDWVMVSANEYSSELEVAVTAVQQAAMVTESVLAERVTTETLQKKDRSPVTVADFASQAVVCAALEQKFPSDLVVAEESADALRSDDGVELCKAVVDHVKAVVTLAQENQVLDWIDRGTAESTQGSDRFWTLDPIDGTKGFLRREQYAIALALIEQGEIVLGVLGCPRLEIGPDGDRGALLKAVRGRGTSMMALHQNPSCEGQSIRVSGQTDPASLRFCESVESAHSNQSHSARVAKALGITADPVRMDSQAKYAAVARGEASIYLRMPTRPDYRECIWDHAAGSIVVEEAGGSVTDIDGCRLDFTQGHRLEGNRGIVATNGQVHDAVIEAVRELQN